MDEDTSPKKGSLKERLEQDYRLHDAERCLLDRRRSHLEADAEERLQKATEAYDIDREADEQDIRKKEEALQIAIQCKEAHKRKHEAQIQSLHDEISDLKRLKQSGEGFSSDKGRQQDSRLFSPQDQLVAARAEAAADNQAAEPQPDDRSDHDALYSSLAEELSDEELIIDDGKSVGHGSTPSHQVQSQNLSSTKKTIAFEEVYRLAQDPDAKHKHWIVEKSGNWYILRCLEHHLNWGKGPAKSAGLHLQSKSHGFSKRENLAFEELGELVEGCNHEKAKMSNDEYKKALSKGYSPNNTMIKPRQEALAKPITKSVQETFEGIVDPVVGEVYHAWWEEFFYSAIVLPHLGSADWKEVGIAGNLFSSGLNKDIPNCFKKSKVTKDSGEKAWELSWAEGYEDGGRKVHLRKFPCLFLHVPLEVPPANQDLKMESLPEVLAFRTAKDLRRPPTVLSKELEMMGVLAYKDLTRDFKAWLRAIRANQNAAPEQENNSAISGQFLSLRDEPYPNTTTSAASSIQHSNIAGVPQHRSIDSNLSLLRDRSRLNPDHNGLASQSTGVSVPSHHRSNATSDQSLHPSAMGRHGTIQGITIFSTRSHAKPSDISEHFAGPNGRKSDMSKTSQPSDQLLQGKAVPLTNFQGLRAASGVRFGSSPEASRLPGNPRGPTALRLPNRQGDSRQSEEALQPGNVSCRRHSADAVERNIGPNGVGQTAWGPFS